MSYPSKMLATLEVFPLDATIPLSRAMVCWNSQEGEQHPISIAVLDHGNGNANRKYDFLRLSDGACSAGYKSASPRAQALYLLGLFTQIVGQDGVPGDQAHQAYMHIIEYEEWVKEGTGPFEEAPRLFEKVLATPVW